MIPPHFFGLLFPSGGVALETFHHLISIWEVCAPKCYTKEHLCINLHFILKLLNNSHRKRRMKSDPFFRTFLPNHLSRFSSKFIMIAESGNRSHIRGEEWGDFQSVFFFFSVWPETFCSKPNPSIIVDCIAGPRSKLFLAVFAIYAGWPLPKKTIPVLPKPYLMSPFFFTTPSERWSGLCPWIHPGHINGIYRLPLTFFLPSHTERKRKENEDIFQNFQNFFNIIIIKKKIKTEG